MHNEHMRHVHIKIREVLITAITRMAKMKNIDNAKYVVTLW